MDILMYLAVAATVGGLLIIVFYQPLLTHLGRVLVRKDFSRQQAALGLIERQVQLSNGNKARYLERPAIVEESGPPLLVLPGATVNMVFMGIQLNGVIKALPQRRIIVIELPFHGQNVAADFKFEMDSDFVTFMAKHVDECRTAIGLDEAADVLGYSLGGGIALQHALDHLQKINRLLLLAPYFYEAATDAYNTMFESRKWQEMHGWESLAEMKQFFHDWLGLKQEDALPTIVTRGVHAIRSDTYPKGYWATFYDAVLTGNAAYKTVLRDRREELARLTCPTLLLTAKEDAICDPKKLRDLKDLIGKEVCTVQELPCRHFFGEKGTTICEVGCDEMYAFLSAEGR